MYGSLISRGLIKQGTLNETCMLTETPISSIKDIVNGKTIREIREAKSSGFQSHRLARWGHGS